MSRHIADQMGGLISVEIEGQKPEKMLNLMMSRGIFVQDVRMKEQGMTLKIRTSALEAARAMAQENGWTFQILHRTGAPVVKKRLKRRMGLWIGLLVIVALLYTGTSFLWFIEVEGNQAVSAEEILRAARSCGFYVGVFQPRVNRLEVEQGILRNMPQLAYAEIKISGVKAKIRVVERVMALEGTEPCDIVARCDGVVEEILLQEGQTVVQKGDAVTQGQVLISGKIYPPVREEESESENEEETQALEEAEEPVKTEPTLVRARGVVKAKVWYEGYGECPIWKEERTASGQEEKSMRLCFPWGEWRLKGPEESPFTEATEQVTEHVIQTPWGDCGWKEHVWQEELVTQTQRTRQEAVEIAKKNAEEALLKQQDWKELPKEVEYRTISQASDVVVRVQVIVEKVEDIAQALPY